MKLLGRYEGWGLVLLRLALGTIFFAHGAQKVLGWFGGHGLSATIDGFQSHLGIPPVLAGVAAFTELLGGLAIVAGLLTRLAALGIAVIMCVAMFKVHWVGGFFLPNGIEYTVALLGMALTLVVLGPGKPSIDAKLCHICHKCEPKK